MVTSGNTTCAVSTALTIFPRLKVTEPVGTPSVELTKAVLARIEQPINHSFGYTTPEACYAVAMAHLAYYRGMERSGAMRMLRTNGDLRDHVAAYRADQLAYYDANLSEADATLEQIFSDFKGRGLTKKTLFVVTADHGESYDHGFRGEHWPSPFESTLRVPLLFYTESSAIPPGRLADRLVSHADFVRTLGYLLGANFETGKDSDSINAFGMTKRTSIQVSSVSSLTYEDTVHQLLTNQKSARAPVLKKDADDLERLGVFYWGRIELMKDGIYKLLHFGSTPSRVLAGNPVRLYNVTADSAEAADLLENGSRKRVLAAGMLDRARNADPFFGLFMSNLKGSPAEVRDAVTRRLDRETIEKLKSLGYLQ